MDRAQQDRFLCLLGQIDKEGVDRRGHLVGGLVRTRNAVVNQRSETVLGYTPLRLVAGNTSGCGPRQGQNRPIVVARHLPGSCDQWSWV